MLVSSRCLIFPYPCHHRFLGCILCLSSSRAFLPMLSFWHKQGSPNLHTGRSNTGHVQVLHICIRPLPGLCKDCQEQHEGTLDMNNYKGKHSNSNLDKIISISSNFRKGIENTKTQVVSRPGVTLLQLRLQPACEWLPSVLKNMFTMLLVDLILVGWKNLCAEGARVENPQALSNKGVMWPSVTEIWSQEQASVSPQTRIAK